jgi:hypothetical protein
MHALWRMTKVGDEFEMRTCVVVLQKNEQSNGIDNQIKFSLKPINLLQNSCSVPPLRLSSSETFVGTFEGILKASLAAFGISWHE